MHRLKAELRTARVLRLITETNWRAKPALPEAIRLILMIYVLGSGLVLVLRHPAGAQQVATVSTEQLYVRRGPGSEFPPFATLGRGDRVEVHEVRGEWARIVTGNGQTGYVRSDFLSLREKEKATPEAAPSPTLGRESPSARPTKTAKPTRTPTATKKPKATATPSPEQPTETPKLRVTRTSTASSGAAASPLATWTPDLATATAVSSPAPALVTPDTAMLERLRVEVARLTLAVEELRRRLDSKPSIEGPLPITDGSAQVGPSGWSMAFAFGVIGALVGWILGASVGRRHERSQRSRIRF